MKDWPFTLQDPHEHDIKFNSFKKSATPKTTIILENLPTNPRKVVRVMFECKLTEFDVVTTPIRYRVINGV